MVFNKYSRDKINVPKNKTYFCIIFEPVVILHFFLFVLKAALGENTPRRTQKQVINFYSAINEMDIIY